MAFKKMLHSESPEAKAILMSLGVDIAKTTRIVIIFEAMKFVKVEVESMVDDEGIAGLESLSNQYMLAKKNGE